MEYTIMAKGRTPTLDTDKLERLYLLGVDTVSIAERVGTSSTNIRYHLANSRNWLVLSKLRDEANKKASNPKNPSTTRLKYAASYRLYTERLESLGAL
jgi:hypothetical protein